MLTEKNLPRRVWCKVPATIAGLAFSRDPWSRETPLVSSHGYRRRPLAPDGVLGLTVTGHEAGTQEGGLTLPPRRRLAIFPNPEVVFIF